MKKSWVILIFLVVALLLVSCSSAPSDNFLISDWSSGGIENVKILRKIECKNISPEAQAQGIEKAWLIAFDYDSSGFGHISNLVRLYVSVDGAWQPNWYAIMNGFNQESCP